MKKSEQPREALEITASKRDGLELVLNPNRLYRASELHESVGRRCLAVLRQHGLRSVGDMYLGSLVLDAFASAALYRAGQRVPSGKEEMDAEHAKTKVEKDRKNGNFGEKNEGIPDSGDRSAE